MLRVALLYRFEYLFVSFLYIGNVSKHLLKFWHIGFVIDVRCLYQALGVR